METVEPVSPAAPPTPSCLDIALTYIVGGLNVTPVKPPNAPGKSPGKAAYVDGWQARRLTADEFRAHFRSDGNVGLVTGRASGIVCLDLDKDAGRAWLDRKSVV